MAKRELLPDPDGLNEARASWADVALSTFASKTGAIRPDVVCHMLTDIRHWCDREGLDFEHELDRARAHYAAEVLDA